MNKLRKWINKDNGKYFQVGNDGLNCLEVLGGVLMICGFLLEACRQKIDPNIPKWAVIAIFAVSVAVSYWGICKKDKKNNV